MITEAQGVFGKLGNTLTTEINGPRFIGKIRSGEVSPVFGNEDIAGQLESLRPVPLESSKARLKARIMGKFNSPKQ